MRIIRLHLTHFRNLEETVLEPDPGFNVFEGDNAQGKTNLLEAVYLLATLKSFRNARNGDLMGWGESAADAEAVVERRGVERTLRVHIERGGRTASVDGKRLQRISHYFDHVNVVLFTPDDLAITKGQPAARRRFIDRAVFNADVAHFERVRSYDQALRNRNALLRQSGFGDRLVPEILEAFDDAVARHGAQVVLERRRFLDGLLEPFGQAYRTMAGEEREVGLRYRSSYREDAPDGGSAAAADEEDAVDEEGATDNGSSDDADELAARARERLRETLSTDLSRGYTGVGPHMDDLVATIDGRPLRRFGSQGQHRAFVLALKVAEIDHLEAKLGFRPVLLLDDVSSELDAIRGRRFMSLVRKKGGQVFITTTDRRQVRVEGPQRAWRIEGGGVTERPLDGAEDGAPDDGVEDTD